MYGSPTRFPHFLPGIPPLSSTVRAARKELVLNPIPLKTLPAALLLVFAHAAASAAETELETIVVTANRVARTADETLAAVTVITRKDIERQQATSVPDLLRGLPGVQFSNNGGPGKSTSLFLRGTNSNHTLVLIDGVRVGSATTGTYGLQDLPIAQIERIEIVRGPRSSLYGSDAIGGVIQIFTRKGPQPASLSLGAGSRQSFEAAVDGGVGTADLWFNAGVSSSSTRGINVSDTANEPDRDGYTRSDVNVRGGGRLGTSLSYDVQARHLEARNKYDGTPNVSDITQELFTGNLRYDVNERFASSLRLAQNLDATTSLKEERFYSRIDTRRNQASWQNDFTLAAGHQFVTGLDWQYDEVLSNNAYARAKRTNRAVFLEYLGEAGRADIQLSGRHDRNEAFGNHNTGSAAVGFTLSPALRLHTSYGTAFKAPTFNDLYYPPSCYTDNVGTTYCYVGNPDIKPETSRTTEAGAGGKLGDFSWDASLFRTQVSNLIEWQTDPANTNNTIPTNVAQARITGLELSASQKLGDTTIAANATFLDPKNRSEGANDGKLLARRARQSGRIDVDHQFGRWGLGTTLNAVGKRYDNAANSIKRGAMPRRICAPSMRSTRNGACRHASPTCSTNATRPPTATIRRVSGPS